MISPRRLGSFQTIAPRGTHQARQRDVVDEGDDGTDFDEIRVEAARGVGDDGDQCAEELHDADWVLCGAE